jgi:hypothetical protein
LQNENVLGLTQVSKGFQKGFQKGFFKFSKAMLAYVKLEIQCNPSSNKICTYKRNWALVPSRAMCLLQKLMLT